MPAINWPGGDASFNTDVTVDGASQPGSGRVQVTGLEDLACWKPCTITGMVIDGGKPTNPAAVVIHGPGSVLQGDYFGTDATGTTVDGRGVVVRLFASRAQIGGPAAGQGDVFASTVTGKFDPAPPVIVAYKEADHVVIQGSWIGEPEGGGAPFDADVGNYVRVDGNDLTFGGSRASDGNTVAGTVALDGTHEVVQGNTFDGQLTTREPAGTFSTDAEAIAHDTIGGETAQPGRAPGNTFRTTLLSVDKEWYDIDLEHDFGHDVVQGNLLQGEPPGGQNNALASGSGIVTSDDDTIGGATDDRGNVITGFSVTGLEAAGSNSVIEHNVFTGEGSLGAVWMEDDFYHQAQIGLCFPAVHVDVVANTMADDAHGIVQSRVLTGAHGRNRCEPNYWQPYPQLSTAKMDKPGMVTVTGAVPETPVGRYRIDLYSSPVGCTDPSTAVGDHWLGSVDVFLSLGDKKDFTAAWPILPADGQQFLTATATDGDGDTSTFGNCISVGTG